MQEEKGANFVAGILAQQAIAGKSQWGEWQSVNAGTDVINTPSFALTITPPMEEIVNRPANTEYWIHARAAAHWGQTENYYLAALAMQSKLLTAATAYMKMTHFHELQDMPKIELHDNGAITFAVSQSVLEYAQQHIAGNIRLGGSKAESSRIQS